MAINLSELTTDELLQVLGAVTAFDSALVLLEDRGVVNEQDGVDVLELCDALHAEREQRAMEDAAYTMQRQIKAGMVQREMRPDGQVGYGLTNDGWEAAGGQE